MRPAGEQPLSRAGVLYMEYGLKMNGLDVKIDGFSLEPR